MTQAEKWQQIVDEVEAACGLLRTANRSLERSLRMLQEAVTDAEED
jgi:hypothetical protein